MADLPDYPSATAPAPAPAPVPVPLPALAPPDPPLNRGNAGKGRRKGSRNRTTLAAKEAIETAAEGMGGVRRLIDWALRSEENERIFWSSIYPKLLPLKVRNEVEVEIGHGLARGITWRPATLR